MESFAGGLGLWASPGLPALFCMTRQERAHIVAGELAHRFPATPIPLDHSDAYTLLVAVMLSAQCTDERVNQVTPGLFSRASTPAAMAALPVEEVQGLIRSCGLAPAKAKNLVALSQQLLSEHGGEVPADWEALEALPGVGHKTASVVMVQAFGVPAFPVDTHIHRLARVWRLSRAGNVAQTERDLKKLYPAEEWGALHLRMIFYGREVCPARGCDGKWCPLCQRLFPPKKGGMLTPPASSS